MEAAEVADLLKFTIPFIIMYNAYIHVQVTKNTRDIAVNSANDASRVGLMEEIKEAIKEMKTEIHQLGLQIAELKPKK
jgi:hypothetical protein